MHEAWNWPAFTSGLLVVTSLSSILGGYLKMRRSGRLPSEADILRWLGISTIVAVFPILGFADHIPRRHFHRTGNDLLREDNLQWPSGLRGPLECRSGSWACRFFSHQFC